MLYLFVGSYSIYSCIISVNARYQGSIQSTIRLLLCVMFCSFKTINRCTHFYSLTYMTLSQLVGSGHLCSHIPFPGEYCYFIQKLLFRVGGDYQNVVGLFTSFIRRHMPYMVVTSMVGKQRYLISKELWATDIKINGVLLLINAINKFPETYLKCT